MYIKEVIIDGFKSYANRTVISGFDPRFNAITGLNGSGKSNILDSICFVLGITNLSQVRATNLQELIYKQGQAGVTKASVTVIFDNQDKPGSPVGYEDYDEISVTRQILMGGRSKYFVNARTAQLSRVQNLFHSVQLNVNNPHFLIMQGRITKVLNMKPPEILSMIEEATGTRMFELKKASALKTIEKKQSKLDEIGNILTDEIEPTLGRLRKDREHFQEWSVLSEEYETLRKFYTAFKYSSDLKALANYDKGFKEVQVEIQDCEKTAAELERKVEDLTGQISSRKSEVGDALRVRLEEIEAEAAEVTKKQIELKTKLESAKEGRTQEKQKLDKLVAQIVKSKEALAKKESLIAAGSQLLDGKLAEARNNSLETLARLQAVYEGLVAGVSSDADHLSVDDEVKDLQKKIGSGRAKQSQLRAKINHAKQQVSARKREAQKGDKEYSAMEKSVSKLETECEQIQQQLKALDLGDAREAAAKFVEKTQSHQKLSQRVQYLSSKLGAIDFAYVDPVRGFDRSRVKGLVANLVTVQPVATTAVEVAAGGKLFQVIVDDERTGKLLLERGQLRRRVTIIPLNKIVPKVTKPEILKLVKGKLRDRAVPAIELVGFDQELAVAMQYVFGGALVCKDDEAAKYCAFTKEIRTKSVTYNGDIYDPAGTLTGGSRSESASVLQLLAELNTGREKLVELEGELKEAGKLVEQRKAAARKHGSLSKDLQLAEHNLDLLKKRMSKSVSHKARAALKQVEQELAKGAEELSEVEKELEAWVSRLEELKVQAQDMEAHRDQMIASQKKEIAQAKRVHAKNDAAFSTQKRKIEQHEMERESLGQEIIDLMESTNASKTELEEADAAVSVLQSQLDKVDDLLSETDQHVNAQRQKIKEADAAISELSKERDTAQKGIAVSTTQAKKVQQKLQGLALKEREWRRQTAKMKQQYAWLEKEKHLFGKEGGPYDFSSCSIDDVKAKVVDLERKLEHLSKTINRKVATMSERAETEYDDLVSKKEIVVEDQNRIRKVIAALDEKKRLAVLKTFEKVNVEFGSILGSLLPGATAKLEPPEGSSILEGLEIRVCLGGTWKDSLSELSGGQKSLLALSLILALLLFKPAPVYILDEIDAALDLSHTQNIGKMLRKHFKQSQFVVVSLKQGMFNNANVVYKTKFVDGVSTASRTTNAPPR